MAGGTTGGRMSALRGRWPAWVVTCLEVSLILALLLTGD
jgi:hypothetical protein